VKLANLLGRAVVISGEGVGLDVERASAGRFSSDVMELFERWPEFAEWASGRESQADEPIDLNALWAPVPRPRQVFALALNYGDHAEEAGHKRPSDLCVFTKFPTAITGPRATVSLPSPAVDWEVELVVVIGRIAWEVAYEAAWSHVAGITVGQDLSDRKLQLAGARPQFSLGKSHRGFAPLGPWLVTVDEVPDPEDLELGCELDGEVVQRARTSEMIWSVGDIIAELSRICPLLPGDLIFTGTPAGVGMARQPARFIGPGAVLRSWVEGVGELENRFVAGPRYHPATASEEEKDK